MNPYVYSSGLLKLDFGWAQVSAVLLRRVAEKYRVSVNVVSATGRDRMGEG